jgi:rare lipoprotein A
MPRTVLARRGRVEKADVGPRMRRWIAALVLCLLVVGIVEVIVGENISLGRVMALFAAASTASPTASHDRPTPISDVPVRAEDCVASVYAVGDASQPGTKTASGIPLSDNAMTAAHKSLPLGSKVKVTNRESGHAVTVTITDRGPYVKGRCIDLSQAGARPLGLAGLAPVTVVPVASD